MAVKHILKNGKVVKDITGHVVKMEDAVNVYTLMRRINEQVNIKEE